MLKIKKIKPLFTGVLTTMDKYEDYTKTKGGLIDPKKSAGAVKEYQKVLAVGSSVIGIKEGDLVCINPNRYAVPKHRANGLRDGVIGDNVTISYNFPVVELDGKQCLLLQNNDIEFVITEFIEEEDPEEEAPSNIIKPELIV